MNRPIGFSTHAIRPDDMFAALDAIRRINVSSIELSALRILDPRPLLDDLESLSLTDFSYVSFHLPSLFDRYTNRDMDSLLSILVTKKWAVIVHPNILDHVDLWQSLDGQICIENMDKRKPVGRTAAELETIFAKFPKASFCFDIGHARQIDPTMSEAALILTRFSDRLKQVHISEVNTSSRHEGITYTALSSFRKVAHLIPKEVPIILETPSSPNYLRAQMRLAEKSLIPYQQDDLLPRPNGGFPVVGDSWSLISESIG